MIETKIVREIVKIAKLRPSHPSLLGPLQLLDQYVTFSLPIETDLSIGLDLIDAYDYSYC